MARGAHALKNDMPEIDPAEVWDPEEFGQRRPNARLLTTGGHG